MRKPLLVASVLFHVAAFGALAVSAWWRIDKLPVEDHGGVVASFSVPQDSGGGAAQQRAKLVPKEEKPKVQKPDVTVQPEKRKTQQVAVTDDDVGEQLGSSTEGPPGNGTGGDGKGKLPPSGDCAAPPCEKKEATVVVEKKEVVVKKTKPPIIIEESAASRISGNSRIEAPNDVKVSMQRAGDEKVIGTIKLCVSAQGSVVSSKVSRSTGYDAYDDKLVSEMSSWRYKPYKRDGEATPFCTFVTLVYIMR